jgi:hypothetical protein
MGRLEIGIARSPRSGSDRHESGVELIGGRARPHYLHEPRQEPMTLNESLEMTCRPMYR